MAKYQPLKLRRDVDADKTYLVKIKRNAESVLFFGSKVQAEAKALELNLQYQTNEYYVEKFDKEKFQWPDL